MVIVTVTFASRLSQCRSGICSGRVRVSSVPSRQTGNICTPLRIHFFIYFPSHAAPSGGAHTHLECRHQNNLDIFLITFYRYGRSYLRVLRYYHSVVSANSREPHKLVLRRGSKDLGELSTSSATCSVDGKSKECNCHSDSRLKSPACARSSAAPCSEISANRQSKCST